MQRVLVIGPCGVGKSTLAKQLARQLKLPLYHLDQLFWLPNWQAISTEEFKTKQLAILEAESAWIIEGNYDSSLDLRLPYADTIIFLDLPRSTYFPRIFKRYLQNFGRTREDMTENCQEQLDWEFIQFVWTFKVKVRPKLMAQLKVITTEQSLIQLRSKKEVREFMTNLSK